MFHFIASPWPPNFLPRYCPYFAVVCRFSRVSYSTRFQPGAAVAKPAAERPKEVVEDGATCMLLPRPSGNSPFDARYADQLEGSDYILKWGTLDKLVEKMTSDLTADIPLTNTVLLTYRSHTSPLTLFQKLIKRYLSACLCFLTAGLPSRFTLSVPPALPTYDVDTWKSKVLLPIRLRYEPGL
jgi:hypothetical protein